MTEIKMETLRIRTDWHDNYKFNNMHEYIVLGCAAFYVIMFLWTLGLFLSRSSHIKIASRMVKMSVGGALGGFIIAMLQFYGETESHIVSAKYAHCEFQILELDILSVLFSSGAIMLGKVSFCGAPTIK